MLPRPRPIQRLHEAFRVHPVVGLLGPRQCGKTTLAMVYAADQPAAYFDLENPVDVQRLSAPMLALGGLSGLVIIDEAQRQPQLFEVVRVLVDRPDNAARFLMLGSASPELVRGVSESLAGRIGFVDLSGFTLDEVGIGSQATLWLRGGFPRAFLAPDERASTLWRADFIRTFLERDVPRLGIAIPPETLRRFWTMTAHYHAQIWNAAELARSLGTSEGTARRYLDVLSGAFVIRVLPPWFENMAKRQIKSPKVYIRDSGLLHTLLGVSTADELHGHPKLGASWEGFALEQTLALLETRDAYFWGTHGGAELDLLVLHRGRRYGFEFKHADAPGSTRSVRVALDDLRLEHLWVVYPGTRSYDIDERTSALAISELAHVVHTLR